MLIMEQNTYLQCKNENYSSLTPHIIGFQQNNEKNQHIQVKYKHLIFIKELYTICNSYLFFMVSFFGIYLPKVNKNSSMNPPPFDVECSTKVFCSNSIVRI